MLRRGLAPAAAVALLSLAAACGPSKLDVASAIESHLRAVAPEGPRNGLGWGSVQVDVIDLTEGPDGLLTAQFQAYDRGTGEGPANPARGPVLTVELEVAGGGIEVARYGDELARSVAVMVAAHRRSRYAPLLDDFEELMDSTRAALSDWARPLKRGFLEAPDSSARGDVAQLMDTGIPAGALRDGIARRGWDHRPELSWGVAEAGDGVGGGVVWLSFSRSPEVVCARLVGGTTTPPGYDWLDGVLPTCRGAGGRYVERYPPEDVLAEIRRAGGVLPPDAGAPPS